MYTRARPHWRRILQACSRALYISFGRYARVRGSIARSRYTTPRVGNRLLVIVATFLVFGGPSAQAQELRAFWADAFSPAIKSAEEIDTLLQRLRAANCNAIFVQVRKGGDAYYVSRYDPWASDNPQRFDGLRYLIEKAHASQPRIQVHAWINTCAVGRSRGNPLHVALRHPEWLSISDKGEDYDGEATKIDPGHPHAADFTFRVYLDVVRHYNVDGIHFDFVRYGGANWGYNPVSVARFNARYGRTGLPAPGDPLWQQWRRDQVTALVRKVYVMAAAVNPKVAVSAATITWGKGPESQEEWATKSAAMTRVFQDWRAWMQEGILDLNCMMSYYSEQRYPQWFRQWLEWAKDHQYKRYAVPASGVWLNTIPDSFQQIAAIRAPSKAGHRSHGVLLYCYASTNRTPDGQTQRFNDEFYKALATDSAYGPAPFAKPTSPPSLPWKVHPTTGHVKGFVLDASSLLPVDGALVSMGGKHQRTDGTGFFAFVDAQPGNAEVVVAAPGYASQRKKVVVQRGRVTTADFFVGHAAVPATTSLEAILRSRDGTPVRVLRGVVVGGSDHFPDRCYVLLPGADTALQVRFAATPVLPLQSGDVVALRGVMGTADDERVVQEATVALVDMQAASVESSGKEWRMPGAAGPPVGRLLAPGILRVAGLVKSSTPERLLLDGPMPVEVVLVGRKDCGVEDVEAPLPAAPALSRVSATGIVTLAVPDGKPVIRIRPRTFEDLTRQESTAMVLLGIAMRVMAGPVVMAATMWLRRG